MGNRVILCFISNRPDLLQKNIPAYFSEIKKLVEPASILVIDDFHSFKQNQTFLDSLKRGKDAPRIYHVCEENARDFAKGSGSDLFFIGKYGGNRNIGLAIASLLDEDVVFLDDDTRPTDNCLKSFLASFGKQNAIVEGKYVGNVGSTNGLLLDLVRVLELEKEDKLSQTESRDMLISIFSGITVFLKNRRLGGELFRGGCLGISHTVSDSYCFFPTSYRIEDALYLRFFDYFVKRKKSSRINDAPIVAHEKLSKIPTTLNSNLENELKGTQVGASINYFISRNCLGIGHLSSAERDILLVDSQKAMTSLYPLEYLVEKLRNERLSKEAILASDAVLRMEMQKLIQICEVPPLLSSKMLLSETERFFHCQKAWRETVTKLDKTGFVKTLMR